MQQAVVAPRLRPLRLPELVTGDPGILTAGSSHGLLRVERAEVAGRDLSAIEFAECELVEWSAGETDLSGVRLLQTRVDRLDAPVLFARRSQWREVELLGSRAGAAEVYEAELDRVLVARCRFGWLNLRGARLRDVVFRDCRFDELDLGAARLARVAFEGCTTGRLVLQGAAAHDLDLRGLEFSALEGIDGLRGAIVSGAQGAELLGLLADRIGLAIAD